jgi:hypothetical protein
MVPDAIVESGRNAAKKNASCMMEAAGSGIIASLFSQKARVFGR